MTDIYTRVSHLADLYYAAEMATRAGNESGLPTNFGSDFERAAGAIYDTISRELLDIAGLDHERMEAGAAALDELRRTAQERARRHIGVKAVLHVPTASTVGPLAREVYAAATQPLREAEERQVKAMRALCEAIAVPAA